MDRELKKASFNKLKPAKKTRPKRTALYALNLCFIGGPAFHCYTRKRKSVVIITSIYKINRLIKDKK
jgi:hypothetical protein